MGRYGTKTDTSTMKSNASTTRSNASTTKSGVAVSIIAICITTLLIFVTALSYHNTTQSEQAQSKQVVDSAAIIERLEPKLDPTITDRIGSVIDKNSDEFGLSRYLVIAIIYNESFPKFYNISHSSKSAKGLMQIKPEAWSKELQEEAAQYKHDQLYHIGPNIHLGCLYLRKCLDETDSLPEALELYYGARSKKYEDKIYDIIAKAVTRKQANQENKPAK